MAAVAGPRALIAAWSDHPAPALRTGIDNNPSENVRNGAAMQGPTQFLG
jgi:hypothetical protein